MSTFKSTHQLEDEGIDPSSDALPNLQCDQRVFYNHNKDLSLSWTGSELSN